VRVHCLAKMWVKVDIISKSSPSTSRQIYLRS
jgi:hypothetical protein